MSNLANPRKAHLWLDGDAFRAPAGTALPSNPKSPTLTGWDAYGGIEAGFEDTETQDITEHDVWNHQGGPYKVSSKPGKRSLKFRAVDNSKATVMTRLRGGRLMKSGNSAYLEIGSGEEFAFLAQLREGNEVMVLYSSRVTLASAPVRSRLSDEAIDGWEFEIKPISPFVEILPAIPDGMTPVNPPSTGS